MKIKIGFEVTNYDTSKIVKQKAYTISHNNKDGSFTRWGVSRRGHKFKTKIYSLESESQINKIFNQAKKKQKKNYSVTIKTYKYTGRLIKKTGKIVGGLHGTYHIYAVGKRSEISYKGRPKNYYTTNSKELIIGLLESKGDSDQLIEDTINQQNIKIRNKKNGK